MKSVKWIVLTVVFLFTTANVSFSQEETKYPPNDYEDIESNYLVGLNSGNSGLKVSSAYFLGEMKSQKAVIPLMKMFREAENDGARLVAAWSLLKIGDPRGTFLVKRVTERRDCEQIRYMLDYLHRDFELKTKPGVIASY